MIDIVAQARPASWAKVIDNTRCIGCHACSTACKSENEVPVGVHRTYVKYVDVGVFPHGRRAFQVTRCNQCEDAPCVTACPTAAMYQRDDGIVDFDKTICIGCKACIAACPYDAIFINPEDHSAEKCNFCAHRLDMGLEPACVVVCPTQAILVGDLHDPTSSVGHLVQRESVTVRRPEKGTRPKLFYRGAHQATLDPLAASRPTGGLFMWSEQGTGAGTVVSGHPTSGNSSAAALLSYDVPHRIPWDWRVSLYTWTKSIAAGAYLAPLILLLLGTIPPTSTLWQWGAPLLGGAFLAATGLLLIADLEHPMRFYMIFTRAQRRSWLVKGAYVITVFGIVLGVHLVATVLNRPDVHGRLIWLGIPAAVLTASYTAFLFAQARARDLWQNPLLPPHFAVQAMLAGTAVTILLATQLEPLAVPVLGWLLVIAGLAHLTLVLGEIALPHPTAHSRLAMWEMLRGRYAGYFWVGIVLTFGSVFAPWFGTPAALLALVGLLAHEHAYVQAGQAVPLA